jgi:hypothetical protein
VSEIKKQKYNYYHVDAGHFPVQIKLCFDNKDFQKILQDHDIRVRANALEIGIAETHTISDGRQAIVILVFDLDECDQGEAYLAGTVAHEATHCVSRVFEHIGEEPDEVGEESRAYLTEHIVRQITQAVINEKAKRARKTNRAVPSKKGQADEGLVLQVDIDSDGGTGQDSHTEPKATHGGAENTKWRIVSSSKSRI